MPESLSQQTSACNFLNRPQSEFCEISKITFFTEHLRTTASYICVNTSMQKRYRLFLNQANTYYVLNPEAKAFK